MRVDVGKMARRRRLDLALELVSGLTTALTVWQSVSRAPAQRQRSALIMQGISLLPRVQRLTGLRPPGRGMAQPSPTLTPRERIGMAMNGVVSLFAVLRLWIGALTGGAVARDLAREQRRARARYILLRHGWRQQGLAGRTRLLWQLARRRGPVPSARWRAVSACAAGIAGAVTFLDDRRRLAEMETRPWYTSAPWAIVALAGQTLGAVVAPVMLRDPRRLGLWGRALAALAALVASVPMGLIGYNAIRLSLLPEVRLRQEHETAEAWRRRFERQKKRRR